MEELGQSTFCRLARYIGKRVFDTASTAFKRLHSYRLRFSSEKQRLFSQKNSGDTFPGHFSCGGRSINHRHRSSGKHLEEDFYALGYHGTARTFSSVTKFSAN